MSEILDIAKKAKNASFLLASISEEIRNKALQNIYDALINRKDEILSANLIDIENAEKAGLSVPMLARLISITLLLPSKTIRLGVISRSPCACDSLGINRITTRSTSAVRIRLAVIFKVCIGY